MRLFGRFSAQSEIKVTSASRAASAGIHKQISQVVCVCVSVCVSLCVDFSVHVRTSISL